MSQFNLEAMQWLGAHPHRDDWYDVLERGVRAQGRLWIWIEVVR